MTRKPVKKPDYSLIYPGIYKAPPSIKQSLSGKQKISGMKKARPAFTIDDLSDHIKVELHAPGFRREDFLVSIKDSRLYVRALHRHDFPQGLQERTGHDFEYWFSRSILLPKNVDTDFVSAEYRNGILCMMFPKTYQHCESKRHSVVVY